LGRRVEEKEVMDGFAAKLQTAANDRALLEGQLRAVQLALERYVTDVEEMRCSKEESEREAQAKLHALQAGFDAQLAALAKQQAQAEADKDTTKEERQKLGRCSSSSGSASGSSALWPRKRKRSSR
jgi:hypothetical protein